MGAMTAAVGGRERRVGGDAVGSEHGPAQEQVGRSVTGRSHGRHAQTDLVGSHQSIGNKPEAFRRSVFNFEKAISIWARKIDYWRSIWQRFCNE